MGISGNLSYVVSLSAFFIVTWASTVAALLPMLLHKPQGRPAIVSGPVITTLVDRNWHFRLFHHRQIVAGYRITWPAPA